MLRILLAFAAIVAAAIPATGRAIERDRSDVQPSDVVSVAVFGDWPAFDPAHAEDAAFVENVMWRQGKVMFVTPNVPGSNSTRCESMRPRPPYPR